MPRFSVRTLLAIVLIAAVICAVMFAFSDGLRIITLFIGVLALPGPLVVLMRRGGPAAKAFALGGLTGYLVWFVIAGVPCGFHALAEYSGMFGVSISGISTQNTPLVQLIVNSYLLFVGLYAPWLVVLLAGSMSLLVHWVIRSK